MLLWYLRMKNWLQDEEGQDLVEYALLVVLIALVMVAVLQSTQTSIQGVFQRIVNELGAL